MKIFSISIIKFWTIYDQRAKDPFKYYKKGIKYSDHMLSSGFFESQTWEHYTNAGLVSLQQKKIFTIKLHKNNE